MTIRLANANGRAVLATVAGLVDVARASQDRFGPDPMSVLREWSAFADWARGRADLDGGRALQDGLYRVEGDLAVLAKMDEWFTPPRGARRTG